MGKCTRLSPYSLRLLCTQVLYKYLRVDSTPLAQLRLGNKTLLLYIKYLVNDICVLAAQTTMIQIVSAHRVHWVIISHSNAHAMTAGEHEKQEQKAFTSNNIWPWGLSGGWGRRIFRCCRDNGTGQM